MIMKGWFSKAQNFNCLKISFKILETKTDRTEEDMPQPQFYLESSFFSPH